MENGEKLARVRGAGTNGIDDLYRVNRPDVDYVVVEYKYGSSRLQQTRDELQMSDGWLTGSNIQYTRHAWKVNLDHYIRCFWLTGLALTLDIPEEQWKRLVVLMGNEGEEATLDRVIAARQPDRMIGRNSVFRRPTDATIAEFVHADPTQRSELLRDFFEHWFVSLQDAGSKEFPKDFRTPYWWDSCNDEQSGV